MANLSEKVDPGPLAADRVLVEREGHPDQYIYPRKAAAESIDTARKRMADDEWKRRKATPLIASGSLRVRFGDVICRTCQGTGGNMIDVCLRCEGKGIEP